MKWIRLRLTAVAVMVAASGITGVALAPASQATAIPSCTAASVFTNSAGYGVLIPTIGENTYNDNCQLSLGNDSYAVKVLQYTLDNCYFAGLAQDSDYGPLTRGAVIDAQNDSGATPDGIYGPQTRNHIKWSDAYGCAKL
jgi:peptidoglycan hydrolase-like protein with peptidoglycan-binding domain